MATILNLQNEAPSVFIREIDRSTVVQPLGPTTAFLAGFTPQGPTDEPTFVTTMEEFELVFGTPTTPAERYAYDSAKQILTTSAGRLLFTRMPYGSGCGVGYSDAYSAIVYPVIGVSAQENDVCTYFRNLTQEEILSSWGHLVDYVEFEQTIGSINMDCVLDPTEEAPNKFVIHNYPFPCDGIVDEMTFVIDDDAAVEGFIVYSLSGDDLGHYKVVESVTITGDEGVFNDGDKTKTVSFASVSGLEVYANGVIATASLSSDESVFSYYTVNSTGKTTVMDLSALSNDFLAGSVSSALEISKKTNYDYLVEFNFIPNDECAKLSCDTITSLGLTIPEGDRYTLSVIPGDCELDNANFYMFLEPQHISLTETEYDMFKNGQFTWKCACFNNAVPALDIKNDDVRAGLIVVNEIKSSQLDDFSGYYFTLTDNYNFNAATDYDAVDGVVGKTYSGCFGVMGEWEDLEQQKLNFQTNAAYNGTSGSISEIIESNIGLEFGKDFYRDSFIVSLFKLRPTASSDITKLDAVLVEKYIGSLDADRKVEDPDGGDARSMFIENVVNNSSPNMKVYVNPYISENNCWADSNGIPKKIVRVFQSRTKYISDSLCSGDFDEAFGQAFDTGSVCDLKQAGKMYSFGSYEVNCVDKARDRCIRKDIGNLPCKLERALRIVDNPNVFDFDITLDAGLSTIWATRQSISENACQTPTSLCYHYDDTVYVDTNSLSPYDGNPISSAIQDGWETIYNIFNDYAQYTRRSNGGVGNIHIQDPLRQIFVNGKDYKIVNRQKKTMLDPKTGQPTERFSTFSRNIWTYLRNLYQSVNSSYSVSYANWIKDYDVFSDKNVWLPISGRIAAMYCRIDTEEYPWYSPFGINRGTLPNILDLGINPNAKEQGLIYRLSVNPVVLFPEGFVVWGNKTLLKKNSALSQVNVRRGLLFLEKLTQRTLRPFIGEQNTLVTRTRVKNALTPIFESAKQNQGLYDYRIVVTAAPEDIDNGCLKVAIYVSPVKGIQYILADFIITKTGVNMGEIE